MDLCSNVELLSGSKARQRKIDVVVNGPRRFRSLVCNGDLAVNYFELVQCEVTCLAGSVAVFPAPLEELLPRSEKFHTPAAF